MEFTPADTLKKDFEVEGSFYNITLQNKDHQCRNQARILRKDINAPYTKDAVFILVNPGSCTPADPSIKIPAMIKDLQTLPFVKAKPDPTQYQIMRLMNRKNWNCVYMINLSDICAGKIDLFKEKLMEFQRNDFEAHTIFSKERKEELGRMVSDTPRIIAGWGANKLIRELALNVLLHIDRPLFGIKYHTHPFYKHPRPQLKEKSIAWLEEISLQLAER
ncbi:hypothetical protein [Bacillus sp. FJAT-44742]|uniref:hypothetical protein n=1 Tax=Bacillus sp. FJAT-44742 TaxID=2014005 RepID=UPI000C235D63|nr:hypothetical protein [Bacillus sp. FJAT-44742]